MHQFCARSADFGRSFNVDNRLVHRSAHRSKEESRVKSVSYRLHGSSKSDSCYVLDQRGREDCVLDAQKGEEVQKKFTKT